VSGATVTVIDRARGIGPRAFDRAGSSTNDPAALAKLAQLQAEARGRDAHGILELALKGELAGKTAVVSSFGSESAVLLHLVAEIDPNAPILFLNTGKLFGETLRYRDRLQELLGLGDIRSLAPRPIDRATRDPDGSLWSRDTDACCNFPQGDAAEARVGRFLGADHRTQALPNQGTRRHGSGGISSKGGCASIAGGLVAGRSGSVCRAARSAAPSACGRRLSFHRLHAVHAARPER